MPMASEASKPKWSKTNKPTGPPAKQGEQGPLTGKAAMKKGAFEPSKKLTDALSSMYDVVIYATPRELGWIKSKLQELSHFIEVRRQGTSKGQKERPTAKQRPLPGILPKNDPLRIQLDKVKMKIIEESNGEKLPDSHPLIKERNHLLAEIKSQKKVRREEHIASMMRVPTSQPVATPAKRGNSTDQAGEPPAYALRNRDVPRISVNPGDGGTQDSSPDKVLSPGATPMVSHRTDVPKNTYPLRVEGGRGSSLSGVSRGSSIDTRKRTSKKYELPGDR